MEYESEGGGCREYEDEREVSFPGRIPEAAALEDYKEKKYE